MSAGMSPFDRHPAAQGEIEAQAARLETLANKAVDLNAVTRAAFDPAQANWDGVCSAELRAAPEPIRRSAQDSTGALAWGAVPLRYWGSQVKAFNDEVDRITGNLHAAAGNHYGARGTDGKPPTGAQISSARAAAEAAARREWHTAYDTHVTGGASTAAGMFRDGPTEENLKAARDVGAISATPGVFTVFPAFWHDTNMKQLAGQISDLAKKFNDPHYRPTEAELQRIRDILGQYANDPAFAYYFLNDLGPRGLLQFNGQIALLQLSTSNGDEEPFFDKDLAATVAALQTSLGIMLATATKERGTEPGYPGGSYAPGRYEMSSQYLVDLMTAGRDTFKVGWPESPFRYNESVYGYQLLAPLLNNGDYGSRFLSLVGGDMVDFERSKGGSEFWRDDAVAENQRFDWTQGYGATTPAGYDPMIPLMNALERNPDAARDLFTGLQSYSSDYQPPPPSGFRLPRLDYLLTDREWFYDVPGGPGYLAMLMDDDAGEKFANPGLDKLGVVLEHATLGTPGSPADERSKWIVESIVYEYNVDEQMRGYDNGETDGSTKRFADNQVIPPVLDDSMANIVKGYIWDVNRAMSNTGSAMPGGMGADFQQTQITRFLAHLGKDEGAHQTIAEAQQAYTVAAYDYYLNGPGSTGDDLNAKLRSAQSVADLHGAVLGALDYGATAAHHQTTADADKAHNDDVERDFKIASFIVDQVVGKATDKIPVPLVGDIASEFIDGIISDAEDAAKNDSTGSTDYTVGEMLGTGRQASTDVALSVLYHSGALHDLPQTLAPGGVPRPMADWQPSDFEAWRTYLDGEGHDSAVFIGEQAGNSYDAGYRRADNTLQEEFG